MLHLLSFNESLLHYLSIMCVTMMVFCVCMNDSGHLLYIYWYILLLVILHVAFSFTTCFIMVVISVLKVENRFQLQCVLLNLLVYIQMYLFVNYSFILYILQFSSVNVFTVFLYLIQNYSGNHCCQNDFVKTTVVFFLQCTSIMSQNSSLLHFRPAQVMTFDLYLLHAQG